MDDFDSPRYMKASGRKQRAGAAAERLRRGGESLEPVVSKARQIAASFWGQAWCRQLASFEYYAGRLAPGRSYLKNGSVLDLKITKGRVEAKVSGELVYDVLVQIETLETERWTQVKDRARGSIESLLDVLQGKMPDEVMGIMTHPEEGLFPEHREIKFSCTCPDWADMCKHVAASLYGVAVRLDEQPELLFRLRGVDPVELLADAAHAGLAVQPSDEALDGIDLGELFGIELDDQP